MDERTADKVVYWQGRQREAMQRLAYLLHPYYCGLNGYYDDAFVVAWQEQHRLAYSQVVRHRGF